MTNAEINVIYLAFDDSQINFNKVLKSETGLPVGIDHLNDLESFYKRKTGKLHDMTEPYKLGDTVTDNDLYMYVAKADNTGVALTETATWNKIQELKDTTKNGLIYPDASFNFRFIQNSTNPAALYNSSDLIGSVSRIDANNFQVTFSESLDNTDYGVNINISEYDEDLVDGLGKLYESLYDFQTTGFKINYSSSKTSQTVRSDRDAIIEIELFKKEV